MAEVSKWPPAAALLRVRSTWRCGRVRVIGAISAAAAAARSMCSGAAAARGGRVAAHLLEFRWRPTLSEEMEIEDAGDLKG